MRFANLATDEGPRLALEVDGGHARLDRLVPDAPSTLEGLLAHPDQWVTRVAGLTLEPDHFEGQVLAPLAMPRSVIAIGLNYHDHCREFGTPPPERPIVFVKLATSIIGPDHDICWDRRVTTAVDWEAELGVVIGRRARDIEPSQADEYIFGYTVINDVTARDIQRAEQQWVRAKSLDTFCPMGPVVVTRDEIDPTAGLWIRSWVNDIPMQASSTAEMIFGVRDLVSYLSKSFTLVPGDVIATGTPLGVGAFRDPPVFLSDGDVVDVEIEGIGRLSNRCRVIQSKGVGE